METNEINELNEMFDEYFSEKLIEMLHNRIIDVEPSVFSRAEIKTYFKVQVFTMAMMLSKYGNTKLDFDDNQINNLKKRLIMIASELEEFLYDDAKLN